VKEHIFAAIVWRDEPEPLIRVEPNNPTYWHRATPLPNSKHAPLSIGQVAFD
jgi:hypothetical protein